MPYFLACALTAAIETPFLYLCGYRDADSVRIAVLTNVVTNLVLNLALTFLPAAGLWVILSAEAAVVTAEYGIYALAFGRSRRLFRVTLAANCLSCWFGLIVL